MTTPRAIAFLSRPLLASLTSELLPRGTLVLGLPAADFARVLLLLLPLLLFPWLPALIGGRPAADAAAAAWPGASGSEYEIQVRDWWFDFLAAAVELPLLATPPAWRREDAADLDLEPFDEAAPVDPGLV